MATPPPNPKPLVVQLSTLGRRAWGLTLGLRLLQCFLAAFAVASLLGWLDASLRWNEPGWRWMSSLLFWLALLLIVRSRLRGFEWSYPSPLQVAEAVERSLELPGRWLSSVVALQLQPQSRELASPSLIDRAVEIGNARALEIRWSHSLDVSKLRRWLVVGLLICIGLIGQFFVWPEQASIAAQRMLVPWQALTWPRQYELEFLSLPNRLEEGDPLVVRLRNRRGSLPSNLRLEWRSMNATEVQAEIMDTHDNVASFRFPPREHSIEVRATGGDDQDMPWHRIDIVQACRLQAIEFEITPPAYLQLPVYQRTTCPLQVIAGSSLRIRGSFSEAVSELQLIRLDPNPEMTTNTTVVTSSTVTTNSTVATGPVTPALAPSSLMTSQTPPQDLEPILPIPIDQDGKSFVIQGTDLQPLLLATSTCWQLEWLSQEGVRSRLNTPWEINVSPDQPPQITLLSPAADSMMAAQAETQLLLSASDDHGIAQIELAWEALDENRKPIGHASRPLTFDTTRLSKNQPPKSIRETLNWIPSEEILLEDRKSVV